MVFEKLGMLESRQNKMPMHLAINLEGRKSDLDYAAKKSYSIADLHKRKAIIIQHLIEYQVKLQIQVLSMHIFSSEQVSDENYDKAADALTDLMLKLQRSEIISESKVKVSVLGRWYDLPPKLVESIKSLMEKTADNDSFHLNFFVNYDGRDEIVDAVKLIARKVAAGKLSVENIDHHTIKNNLYLSYFESPDLVIKTGSARMPNFMIWDLPQAKVHFTRKHWFEFGKNEFLHALNEYSS